MQAERAIAMAGIVFFAVSGVLVVRSVRKGRELSRLLETRFPGEYEALGRPFPGYFDGPRRNRYFQFIMRREFRNLSDPFLVEQFQRHHRSEVRLLSLLLSGLGLFGLAFVWFHWR